MNFKRKHRKWVAYVHSSFGYRSIDTSKKLQANDLWLAVLQKNKIMIDVDDCDLEFLPLLQTLQQYDQFLSSIH